MFRLITRKILISIAFVLSCLCQAQTCLNDSALIPVDERIKMGRLENGLTYYIRYNNWPEKRACFYLAQRVGSMQEEDNQRGLAHFLEHMCFNGSEHFPGKGIERFCESIGLDNGGELNAYTSLEETVYNIDDVPTDIGQEKLDSCLLILYDWAHGLTLDSAKIEKERSVIHEEWRSHRSASSRIYERQLPIFFPDSKYGHRLPIGLMEVVDSFKHQELRDYYKKWYQPENQCIVVVGDIDVEHTEAKIKELFGGIVSTSTAKVVREPVVDHKGIIYSIDQDKELQDNSVFVWFKHKAYTSEERKYVGHWKDTYKTSAALGMLNERFYDLSLADDCPFLSASADDDDYSYSTTKRAFELAACTKDGMQEAALTGIVKECRRAMEFGFTQEEYSRYQQNRISSLEDFLMSADKRESSTLIEELYGHYLHGTEMSSAEDYVRIMKEIILSTPLDSVNLRMRQLLPKDNENMVIGSWNIEKDSVAYPTRESLLEAFQAGRNADIEPYQEKMPDVGLLTEIPQKGSIVEETYSEDFDYHKMILSNGATVLLKHTNIENSQVLFKAYGKGGWTMYGEEDDPNINLMNSVSFGNNGLTLSQISKLLAGKRVNLSHSLSQQRLTFTGSCNPLDMECFMQLLHAEFTNQTKDEADYQKTLKDIALDIRNNKADPESAFSDSITVTFRGHHPRFKLQTEEDLTKADYDRMLSMIQDQTACAKNYTFLFVGNYNDSTIRPLIETYIASLPNKRDVKAGPYIKTWLQQDAFCHFKRKMETPKTIVSMDWFTEKIPYTLENWLLVKTACGILDMVYEEKIREENSATYGCSVDYYITRGKSPDYLTGFSAICSMRPEMCDSVLTIMKQEFVKLSENVDDKMFAHVRENMLKSLEELESTQNGFWLDIIWSKEDRGIDVYTDRRRLTEQLTKEQVVAFMKSFLEGSHFCEILMEPEE